MSQQNKTFLETLRDQRRGSANNLYELSDSQKELQRRMFPPDAFTDAFNQRLRNTKKGSYTVPEYCKGGKVIKSWSK
jgi:hypothetical protein